MADTVRAVEYDRELLVLLFLFCTIHRTTELRTLITVNFGAKFLVHYSCGI